MKLIENPKAINRAARALSQSVNRLVELRPPRGTVPPGWDEIFDEARAMQEKIGKVSPGNKFRGPYPEKLNNVKIRFSAMSKEPEKDLCIFFENLGEYKQYVRSRADTKCTVSGFRVTVTVFGIWAGDPFDCFDWMDEKSGLTKGTGFHHAHMEVLTDEEQFSI